MRACRVCVASADGGAKILTSLTEQLSLLPEIDLISCLLCKNRIEHSRSLRQAHFFRLIAIA
jgi:hypothetical protein